jgi:hypothetical protein
MQSHDSSPGHQVARFTGVYPTDSILSLDGKTMAVLRRRSSSDVVAWLKVVNVQRGLGLTMAKGRGGNGAEAG